MTSCTCLHSASLGDLISEIRRRAKEQTERAVIRVGDCAIDVAAATVLWRGRTTQLTSRQAEVLVALAGAHPVGLTADDIVQLVWQRDDVDPHQARVYVYHLRRRLPGLLERLDGGHRYRIAPAARAGAVA